MLYLLHSNTNISLSGRRHGRWRRNPLPLPKPEPKKRSFEVQKLTAGRHPQSHTQKVCVFPTFPRPKMQHLWKQHRYSPKSPRENQAGSLCHTESAVTKTGDHNILVFTADVKANQPLIKQAVRKLCDTDMAKVCTPSGLMESRRQVSPGSWLWSFAYCQQTLDHPNWVHPAKSNPKSWFFIPPNPTNTNHVIYKFILLLYCHNKPGKVGVYKVICILPSLLC